jgi:transposase
VIEWVGRFPDREVHVAVEACTGWYFVCRALEAAGAVPHLAEVAETRARRGPKRRAKTDRADARWLRTLLSEGQLPEAWIPPDHICWLRIRTRLRTTLIDEATAWRTTLIDEATAWRQRIQATLFHLGEPSLPLSLKGEGAQRWLQRRELPTAARERIEVSLSMIEAIEGQLRPLERELRRYARRQPGARALAGRHFGIGELTATTIVAELGDTSRLRRSRQAVRMAGIDVGVSRSDRRTPSASSPSRARRIFAGRSTRRRSRPAARAAPTTPTTWRYASESSPTPGPR